MTHSLLHITINIDKMILTLENKYEIQQMDNIYYSTIKEQNINKINTIQLFNDLMFKNNHFPPTKFFIKTDNTIKYNYEINYDLLYYDIVYCIPFQSKLNFKQKINIFLFDYLQFKKWSNEHNQIIIIPLVAKNEKVLDAIRTYIYEKCSKILTEMNSIIYILELI